MSEKRLSRPDESLFVRAAFRIINDDYSCYDPFYGIVRYNDRSRKADEDIIFKEWNVDGIGTQLKITDYFDIESMALKLLAVRKRDKERIKTAAGGETTSYLP